MGQYFYLSLGDGFDTGPMTVAGTAVAEIARFNCANIPAGRQMQMQIDIGAGDGLGSLGWASTACSGGLAVTYPGQAVLVGGTEGAGQSVVFQLSGPAVAEIALNASAANTSTTIRVRGTVPAASGDKLFNGTRA